MSIKQLLKSIVKCLLFIWQLPQNMLGIILRLIYRSGICVYAADILHTKWTWNSMDIHLLDNFKAGISLGDNIIFSKDREFKVGIATKEFIKDVLHEHGHQIQSIILGPLYLIIVGVPSLSRNIWDILFHKKWTNKKRLEWYYGGFPERWADKLGGVER